MNRYFPCRPGAARPARNRSDHSCWARTIATISWVNWSKGQEALGEPARVVGQAVCDLRAGGGRGVQESAGEPGRAGGGWVHDRGVRVRSAEQIVCDVESDVLGQLLSAAGESRRGSETAR